MSIESRLKKIEARLGVKEKPWFRVLKDYFTKKVYTIVDQENRRIDPESKQGKAILENKDQANLTEVEIPGETNPLLAYVMKWPELPTGNPRC